MRDFKILVVLVASFISVGHSGFGQLQNTTPEKGEFVSEDFFPLQVGNTWTYSLTGLLSISVQTRIIDSTLINQQVYFVYDGVMYPIERDTLRADSAGSIVIYTAWHWIRPDPGAQEFMLFNFTLQNYMSYPYVPYPTSSITLVSIGNVTVPAGMFPNCVQLSFKGAMVDDDVAFTFARGVGIVKMFGPFYGNYELKSAFVSGKTISSSAEIGPVLPASIELLQAFPNPFNPSTTIRYGLPHKSAVQLTVFNTLGQQVALLQNGEQEAGYHEVKFDASGLSSGVYFYRMQAGDFVQTRKLLLIR